jgi:hypothetical protein
MQNLNVRKWLIVVACLLVVLAIAAWIVAVRLEPAVKARTEKILSERFDSDVSIGRLRVTLLPVASVTADNLVIRYHHLTDVPPLIKIRRFTARTDIPSIFGAVRRIHLVKLEGLEIRIPSGALRHDQFVKDPDATDGNELRPTQDSGNALPFLITEISADGTLLEILPKKAGSDPLDYDIRQLKLRSVGPHRPMTFVATLMNAKPPGLIQTAGEFGPWQKQDPSATRVSGKYVFRDADLGVFKGISGTLASEGAYTGELDSIEVRGSTDTPNFQVGHGTVVRLKTNFSALVDGTSGDTFLRPVEASFRDSSFICRGGVAGTPGVKGKAVSLNVVSKHARIEDLTALVVQTKAPLMIGNMTFQSEFLLPQGDAEVLDKLYLKGRFDLTDARFTNPAVQDKIDTLSNRGRGIKKDSPKEGDDVASNFAARFTLKRAIISLSALSFSVPGAHVRLNGHYGLKSEALDFHGHIRLRATLSHMVSGWKSLLLKPVDPFFKKDGAGAVLPIKITGTKSDPHYGLDFHHKDKS